MAARRRESEKLDTNTGWVSSLDVDKDGSYDPNLVMNWYFLPETRHMLLLSLLYIDTEISQDCKRDVLKVVRSYSEPLRD